MVRLVTLITALAGMSSIVYCAPTDSVTITVKNTCSFDLQVNQLTNDVSTGTSRSLAAGGSTSISVPSTWGGRIWARKGCSGDSDCRSGDPASLAEFLLSGAAGLDYYDISFVDGFNLPMEISPNSGTPNGFDCGVPTCTSLPECPSDLQVKDSDGNMIACKSSCTASGDCLANEITKAVKAACPNVYTFPTDDPTSMYACAPGSGYTVTFC